MCTENERVNSLTHIERGFPRKWVAIRQNKFTSCILFFIRFLYSLWWWWRWSCCWCYTIYTMYCHFHHTIVGFLVPLIRIEGARNVFYWIRTTTILWLWTTVWMHLQMYVYVCVFVSGLFYLLFHLCVVQSPRQ